jgi:hypothetical protein
MLTVTMEVLEPELRDLGSAISIFSYNLIGSIPGPVVMGAILDRTDDNYQVRPAARSAMHFRTNRRGSALKLMPLCR